MAIMQLLNLNVLKKAKIYRLEKGMALSKPIEVQFNPSEYHIARTMRTSKKYSIGKDPDIENMQAVCGELANLTVSLYFDTISDQYGPGGLLGGIVGLFRKDPPESAREIATLLKYNEDDHAPLKVRFVWGSLDFVGVVCSSTMAYTMFKQSGTPVRAKVDLTIRGEETDLLRKKMSLPFQSPNRTKERVLTEGDALWMMAQQEYDNPGMWKPIAAANGILNPRRLEGVTTLKVPSIK